MYTIRISPFDNIGSMYVGLSKYDHFCLWITEKFAAGFRTYRDAETMVEDVQIAYPNKKVEIIFK